MGPTGTWDQELCWSLTSTLIQHPGAEAKASSLGGSSERTPRGFPSLAMGFVISRCELFRVWLCLQCICSSHTPSNGKNRWLFNF